MPCTAMISLILNSTEYLAPELLNKIATAIYTAARQVIEEEGKESLDEWEKANPQKEVIAVEKEEER